MIKRLFSPVVYLGLLQATEVTLYCSLIGLLFWKGSLIFGKAPSYFAPVAFLLLFSFSAMACGLIVFYRPYRLFFDNKKREAADVVLYSAIWLFAYFLLFLLLAVFLH